MATFLTSSFSLTSLWRTAPPGRLRAQAYKCYDRSLDAGNFLSKLCHHVLNVHVVLSPSYNRHERCNPLMVSLIWKAPWQQLSHCSQLFGKPDHSVRFADNGDGTSGATDTPSSSSRKILRPKRGAGGPSAKLDAPGREPPRGVSSTGSTVG